VSNGSRPPVGPTPTLLSIFRDLARPTPRIENLGVVSHTKVFGVGFETRLRKIRFVVESEVRISYSAAGGGLAQGKNTTKGHGCISEVFGLERIHGIFVSYVFVFVLIVEAGGWEVGCKWGLGLRHQTTNSQFTRKQEPISVVSAQRGLVLLLKERALMLEQAQVCVMFWPALMNDTSHALSFGLVVQKPKSAKHVQN